MAAYGALVSVMNIIETIQNHPRPPISFDIEQLQSLTKTITFLQEFLETHSIDDDSFESRIADAAYAAEDVIEFHIVDQIKASNTISFADFYEGLRKVIQDLDLIQRDTARLARKTGIKDDDDDAQLLPNNYSLGRPHPSTGQDTVVGLDEVRDKIMDKLTWNQSKRRIFPTVGMGGIGKTTLARHVYDNPVIVQYFDLRGWATISQEYKLKQILLEVLLRFNTSVSMESLNEMSEDKLGENLYKSLCGRRYLIVFDDIWSIEAWDKLKTFFPDNNNGSAIMLTTRLSNLASHLSDSCVEMSFLDEDKSWKLFCKTTFGEESYCPRELESVGKKIVQNCKGLPLSIVVAGGLVQSEKTRKYWLYIVGNLNSKVNSKDDQLCLKILHLSYKELPVHLKPCFLYMGVFPEDSVIDVPNLIRLWVAEGFLKPISGKCLEVVAKEYFNNLVCRNLILVHKRDWNGETIKCKVHDLLVDVCVREAQKHKFLSVARHYNFSNPQDLYTQRHIVFHHDFIMHRAIPFWPSHHRTLIRSVTNNFLKSFVSKLLRVWKVCGGVNALESTNEIINCRYISGIIPPHVDLLSSTFSSIFHFFMPFSNPRSLSSIRLLWNLQTLYIENQHAEVAILEIWKMSQLRHVYFDRLNILDPPNDGGDDFVLVNLQTLSHVRNFKVSKDVVRRIPNIKELGVYYEDFVDWSSCCLNNLARLNLESLYFALPYLNTPIPSLTFPCSLKELRLQGTILDWGDLGTKIGSLPYLQVLKLEWGSFEGPEWVTVEGQFRSLKYLRIHGLHNLMYWRTESWTHFPCLEHLSLCYLRKLKGIPLEIGATLKSIKMAYCSDSAVFSANEILKEQGDLGNEDLQVEVIENVSELLLF